MITQKDQICKELKTLGAIGFTPDKGTTRVAYSKDFYLGRSYVENLMRKAGLKVCIDSVGNLIGLKEGTDPSEKIISLGSHIDSVPGGGIYDGCLGVLGAIACIRKMCQEGYQNRHPLEVIAFIEEEGNAVGGTFGSKCFTGTALTDGEKEKAEALGISITAIKQAKRQKADYAAYLELHIEQGGILENENLDIGIVEGIVGIYRYHCSVKGQANHAGTTPMYLRDDAFFKSVVMLKDLFTQVSQRKDGMVCTVGSFHIVNPAVNVVPGETEFILEARSPHTKIMVSIIEQWKEKYEKQGLTVAQFSGQRETEMEHTLLNKMEEICTEKGYSYKRMFSGAGHDAMNMASFTPSAMIFIPSMCGISHRIKEYSNEEEIEKGTEVLYQMIKKCDQI